MYIDPNVQIPFDHLINPKNYHFFQDCSACSLSKLSLYDLIVKAQLNEQCLLVAREIFHQNFRVTKFYVAGPFIADESNAIDDANQQQFYIKNSNLVSIFLRIFGDLIRKFAISFESIDACPGKEVIESVNRYCSKSLFRLELENCKENVLDELKNTFLNMRTVLLSSSQSKSLEIGPDAVKLNKLFPNLESLLLKYTKKKDWDLIGDTFPNLTMLVVELPAGKEENRPDETDVGNLLRKNLNIEILSIQHSTLHVLKEANDILLYLKNLEIKFLSTEYLNYDGDPIRFNNVRQLTVHSDRSKDEIPEYIFFDQLLELKLYIKPDFTDKWILFISNQLNKNIIKLTLSTGVLAKEQFIALTYLLPKLNGVSIESSTDYAAKDIINFIENSHNLVTLRMKVPMEISEERILRTKLQNKWHYKIHSEGDKVHMVFQRYFIFNIIQKSFPDLISLFIFPRIGTPDNAAHPLLNHFTQILTTSLILLWSSLMQLMG